MIHEEKYCPCCKNSFTCMPGNIFHCECSQVKLPEKVKEYIGQAFSDCLCINCLNTFIEVENLKKNPS